VFSNEAGGHRFQRVSPTERRGRVHTSTVTVAILEETESNFQLKRDDVEIFTTRGTGKGGQKKNKTESCVFIKHKDNGLIVKSEKERSQYQNKAQAFGVLKERLQRIDQDRQTSKQNSNRRNQIGSGMRGDKIKTYRERDDVVTDHRTGEKSSYSQWKKGIWE